MASRSSDFVAVEILIALTSNSKALDENKRIVRNWTRMTLDGLYKLEDAGLGWTCWTIPAKCVHIYINALLWPTWKERQSGVQHRLKAIEPYVQVLASSDESISMEGTAEGNTEENLIARELPEYYG